MPGSPGDKKNQSASYDGLTRSKGQSLVMPSRIRTSRSSDVDSGDACHQVDDFLVARWEIGMPSVAVNGTDGGVRVDDEGARVGFPFATVKVQDAKGSFPYMNA